MKRNQRDQYKRIFSFFSAVLLVGFYAAGFAWVWYHAYSERILLPFYRKGNWTMIVIYMLMVLLFSKAFGGLKIGYLKRSDMLYSQLLSILSVNFVTYFQISVVNHAFTDASPLFVLTLADIFILAAWIFFTNKLYFRLYPPRRLVIFYGNKKAAELVVKMSRRVDKYMICESVSAQQEWSVLEQAMERYEGVILCETPPQIRNDLLKYCFSHRIRVYIAPKISDIILRGAEEIRLFDTPLLLCRNGGLTFEQRLWKRSFDLIFASISAVLLSPVMVGAAIAIKMDDGGPVFYKQRRLTEGGRHFYVYKFRSMVTGAEKNGPQLAKDDDARITRVGAFLRKTRIDELPQLFNILQGDMSVVGPRPERPELAAIYRREMPEFDFRLQVKAGLTGYAQVTGYYDTQPYDKLKMDMMYIENCSILLDLQIILMTLKTALFPPHTNEEMEAFDKSIEQQYEQKERSRRGEHK